MTKVEIIEAFRFRHAAKEFDPDKKISKEDFEFILEAGRLSPSSFGFEPWKFIIAQNMELRHKFLPFSWGAQKQLPTASHFVLLLSRTKAGMAFSSGHIQNMLREVKKFPEEMIPNYEKAYHKFLASDFNILDNDRAVFEWSSRQTYIALGNMMTAAALIGIDSCPIEGFDKQMAEDLLRSEGLLAGDEFGLSCMLAFGYRVREPRPKTRRPMEQVVEWVN